MQKTVGQHQPANISAAKSANYKSIHRYPLQYAHQRQLQIQAQRNSGERSEIKLALLKTSYTNLRYCGKCWAMREDIKPSADILLLFSMPVVVMVSRETETMSTSLGGGLFTSRGIAEASPATRRCKTTRSSLQLSETVHIRVLKVMVGMKVIYYLLCHHCPFRLMQSAATSLYLSTFTLQAPSSASCARTRPATHLQSW